MRDYYFERECRTPHSECYAIEAEGNEIGRVDIHFTASLAYATLCVGENLSDEDTRDLIGEIDEKLVLTTDPFREDFVVTVWAGREAAVYSDEDFSEDEEDEEEEEELEEGNGHRA
ncbi:MAG: hypothetical protein MUP14_09625 [Dehalococcoidia bacterium]|nr:hypothetical protein [Dehalococcoidia bacterium]